MKKVDTYELTTTICIVVAMYINVSLFAFYWRNPELTQMEVIHNFVNAMLWQDPQQKEAADE